MKESEDAHSKVKKKAKIIGQALKQAVYKIIFLFL